MTTTTQTADDVVIPETLPEPDRTWVARLHVIGYETPPERMQARRKERNLPIYPMLHVAWEALSFQYDFNPDIFPDNYEHDWLPVYSNDGKILGDFTQFGQVHTAFKALGYPLTKNEVFKAMLEGKTFKVETKTETYKRNDGTEGRSSVTVPVEELASYTLPTPRRVVQRGYGGSSFAPAQVSQEQIDALKIAMNGRSEDEYVDGLIENGLIDDPFMAEATDGPRLTRRLIGYGGKVMAGRIFFEEA